MFETNDSGGFNPKLPRFFVIGFIAIIFLLITGGNMFYTVNPGEKAVVFKRFGGGLDKDLVVPQGFHFIAQGNKVYIYNVKIHANSFNEWAYRE